MLDFKSAVSPLAPTGNSIAISKLLASDDLFGAAVTTTKPKNFSVSRLVNHFDYNEPTEALACEIDHFRHDLVPLLLQVERLAAQQEVGV
jgi:hypothetical protein